MGSVSFSVIKIVPDPASFPIIVLSIPTYFRMSLMEAN